MFTGVVEVLDGTKVIPIAISITPEVILIFKVTIAIYIIFSFCRHVYRYFWLDADIKIRMGLSTELSEKTGSSEKRGGRSLKSSRK